jgi:enoyl-CoA hydratase/carnithine racemase
VADVRVEVEPGIGWIVISQPARRNALNRAMWRRLAEIVNELAARDDVGCLVLRGEGTAAFSAGADVSELGGAAPDVDSADAAYSGVVAAAETALVDCPKLTVAMLHGICMGGGVVLALACDLRFADDGLRFAIPAARLGVVYPPPTVARLARLIGPSAALDLLASAREVGSEEALKLGLVNRVKAAPDLETAVREYSGQVASGAQLSIRGAKLAVRAAEEPANQALRDELDAVQRAAAASGDHREGIAAFLQKRPPRFDSPPLGDGPFT